MSFTSKKDFFPYSESRSSMFYFTPPSKPLIGLYACNPGLNLPFPLTASPYMTTNYDWASPIIDGDVERMTWAALEPTRGGGAGIGLGTYSFAMIDTECQHAIANGKSITLDIYGGMNAPAWLFSSPYLAGTDFKQLYVVEPGPAYYCTYIPLPWSSSYISNFDTFIKKLGAHLTNISYTQGGSVHHLIDAIKVLKIGTCCTKYTSELRVPNEICSGSSPGCCPFDDSATLVGLPKYTLARLESSID